jgi:hypothetical protein
MLPEEAVTIELPIDMVRSKELNRFHYRVIDGVG